MLRPPRVQRPGRLPDRLGAPPRLRDRDRARRALHAALLRARGRLAAAHAPPVGRRRRGLRRSSAITVAAADPPAGLYRIAIVVAVVAFVTQRDPDRPRASSFLFAPSRPGHAARTRASRRPGTRSRSPCRSRCSRYTGLETVANLAQEAREPGKTLPRSLFVGLGAVVVGLRRDRRRRHRRLPGVGTARPSSARDWHPARRCVGIVSAFNGHMPAPLVDVAAHAASA